MKKPLLITIIAAIAIIGVRAEDKVTPTITGKQIYIPKDLQGMDLTEPESQWSYARMDTTENLAIFWEKGFGKDVANAPQLEGKNMTFDLNNLKEKLEEDYKFFRDSLQFVRKGSKSEKYRMMVMINYSLEGTAYGGDYDQTIGGLWLAPNRIQDKQLNCIAHELGHSFQCQLTSDGDGVGWGGCGFYEMAAQWMLWQMSPQWMDDENYHWQAFRKLFHKAYLDIENIYHSPFIIEYWAMKKGKPFIAELFRQGLQGEDPVMTYKKLLGMTQYEFCDDMFHASSRIVNMDFPRVWNETRRHALQLATPMDTITNGRLTPRDGFAPENYGFNVIEVFPKKGKRHVSVSFEGKMPIDATPEQAKLAGWRYGFVGVTEEGRTVYGDTFSAQKGKASFGWDKSVDMAHVYLVVMGAPKEHWIIPEEGKNPKWNYEVLVRN